MIALDVFDFSPGGMARAVGAWLLTYLLHSTLLLTAALVLNALARGWSDSMRELVLRFAIVGGIVSATVTMVLPAPADSSAWWADALSYTARLGTSPRDQGAVTALPGMDEGAEFLAAPAGAAVPQEEAGAPEAAGGTRIETPPMGPADFVPNGPALAVMLIPFALGCALAMRTVLLSHRRLARELRGRQQLPDDSLPRRLLNDLLCKHAPRSLPCVRLSASDHIEVPIAMGILRPEICLPRKRIHELDEPALRLTLAHELAHLVRRDPQWQLAFRMVESALFLQPLNIWARRTLRVLAEFQCDGWAAQATGERTQLARVLADVAQWLVASRRNDDRLAPVASMAERRSAIRSRIDRLLSDPPAGARRPVRRGTAAAGCLAAITTVSALSPRLMPARPPEMPASNDLTVGAAPADDTRAATRRISVTATLEQVLVELDEDIALLEAESHLLGQRARAAGADAQTLSLLENILSRLALLRAQRDELERVLDWEDPAGANLATPLTPDSPGRRSP